MPRSIGRMGDHFQNLFPKLMNVPEAAVIAERVCEWMVAEELILPERSPEPVLGAEGYRPGPAAAQAAGEIYEGFFAMRTNGVEIFAKPTVFYTTDGHGEIDCPRCSSKIPDTIWLDVVDPWIAGESDGCLECPTCASRTAISQLGNMNWGFSSFGLKFWNWPGLLRAETRVALETVTGLELHSNHSKL